MVRYDENQIAYWNRQAPDGWHIHPELIKRGHKVLLRLIPQSEKAFVEALLFYPLDFDTHYVTLSVTKCRKLVGDFYTKSVPQWIQFERVERRSYKKLCEVAATITDDFILSKVAS